MLRAAARYRRVPTPFAASPSPSSAARNFALAPYPRLFPAIASPDGFRVSRPIRRDTTDRPTSLRGAMCVGPCDNRITSTRRTRVRGRRRTRGRTQRDTEIAGRHYVGRACPPTTRDRKVYRGRGLAGPDERGHVPIPRLTRNRYVYPENGAALPGTRTRWTHDHVPARPARCPRSAHAAAHYRRVPICREYPRNFSRVVAVGRATRVGGWWGAIDGNRPRNSREGVGTRREARSQSQVARQYTTRRSALPSCPHLPGTGNVSPDRSLRLE